MQLIIDRLKKSRIREPSGTGWVAVIDDVYTPRPHIRMPLSDKAVTCPCPKISRRCPTHRGNKQRLKGLAYSIIYAILDADGKLERDVMDEFSLRVDANGNYDPDRVCAFVSKLSIVATGCTPEASVRPADFKSTPRRGRPKRQREDTPENKDMDALLSDFVWCIYKCRATSFTLAKGRNRSWIIETDRKRCPNVGREHTSNRLYIHVSTERPAVREAGIGCTGGAAFWRDCRASRTCLVPRLN